MIGGRTWRWNGPARRALAIAGLLAATPPAVAAAAPNGPPWFEEVAGAAGVDFGHVRAVVTRYWMPEIMSGGAAWCDVDGDGWLDLYLVQGGELAPSPSGSVPGNRLYRNLGDGTFADVTVRAGVGDTGYGMGAACADFDGDGTADLYVTNVGANRLYLNNGDGTLRDATAAWGAGDRRWGASAAPLDFDGDGDLDLFVANYLEWSPQREIHCTSGARRRDYCQPANYAAPAPDLLLRNDGDRFTDVSSEAGLGAAYGNGLGVVADDFDGDGWTDLYVANDGNANQLWINTGDGRFEDRALLAGAAVNMSGETEAGMGVAAADLDADGDTDLLVTHLGGESNTFYRNQSGFFEDATVTAGLAAPSLGRTGFGTGFADFDRDGLLDLYIANGRVGQGQPAIGADPFAEPDLLLAGQADGGFAEVSPPGGVAPPLVDNGRAAALADYDNDGDVDLAIVVNGGPTRLLRNVAVGDDPSWLAVRVTRPGGADALGARLWLGGSAGPAWRTLRSASSYCAASDPRAHFGLGPGAGVASLEVWRPGGARRRYHLPRAGAFWVDLPRETPPSGAGSTRTPTSASRER